MGDEDAISASGRKRNAEIHNERVKLSANALNALAVATAVAALIIPGVASPSTLVDIQAVTWLSFALVLHFSARAILGLLKSED